MGPSAGLKHHECKRCVEYVRLGRYFFSTFIWKKTSTRGCRWDRQGGTQRVQMRNICTHRRSRRRTQRPNPRLKTEPGCDVDERMQRLSVIHVEQSWVPLGPLTFYSWSVYTPDHLRSAKSNVTQKTWFDIRECEDSVEPASWTGLRLFLESRCLPLNTSFHF